MESIYARKENILEREVERMLFSVLFFFSLFPKFSSHSRTINPFPNDEILDEIKLKAFADDKFNNKNDISVFDRVENMVTSIFSISHNVFKRLVSQARQKVSLCGNGLNSVFVSG